MHQMWCTCVVNVCTSSLVESWMLSLGRVGASGLVATVNALEFKWKRLLHDQGAVWPLPYQLHCFPRPCILTTMHSGMAMAVVWMGACVCVYVLMEGLLVRMCVGPCSRRIHCFFHCWCFCCCGIPQWPNRPHCQQCRPKDHTWDSSGAQGEQRRGSSLMCGWDVITETL